MISLRRIFEIYLYTFRDVKDVESGKSFDIDMS